MSDDKKAELDSESILITLDQLGQTIDIMTNVVGRLRGYITEQIDQPSQNPRDIELSSQQAEHSQTIH